MPPNSICHERAAVNESPPAAPQGTFWERNEFILRRLHSLSGIVPVGAYMVVHLLTNASVLDSPAAFQRNVYQIHSLGAALPVVEWVFIFLPLLYHAIYGVLIVRGALPNSSTYKTSSNFRYTLQRATGMIAFVFIMWHVFHMHGWFHFDAWEKGVAEPLSGAQFKPFNAASTAAKAMQLSLIVPILYAIGVLSCVFHLANGIWTFGITWGIWVTPRAQQWATTACLVFGLGLAAVSMGALGGFAFGVDIKKAQEVEKAMYDAKVASKEIAPNEHKLAHPKADEADKPKETAAVHASGVSGE
jgi:succinate dehydrogenase / fumarate reductase cytochrome b subunit